VLWACVWEDLCSGFWDLKLWISGFIFKVLIRVVVGLVVCWLGSLDLVFSDLCML
jgi:hypothetical protein